MLAIFNKHNDIILSLNIFTNLSKEKCAFRIRNLRTVANFQIRTV